MEEIFPKRENERAKVPAYSTLAGCIQRRMETMQASFQQARATRNYGVMENRMMLMVKEKDETRAQHVTGSQPNGNII